MKAGRNSSSTTGIVDAAAVATASSTAEVIFWAVNASDEAVRAALRETLLRKIAAIMALRRTLSPHREAF